MSVRQSYRAPRRVTKSPVQVDNADVILWALDANLNNHIPALIQHELYTNLRVRSTLGSAAHQLTLSRYVARLLQAALRQRGSLALSVIIYSRVMW